MSKLSLLWPLFLIACSQTPSVDKLTALEDHLQAICLTSEGKGRIGAGSKRYLFSYESLLQSDKRVWALSFNVPLRGEETYLINWRDELNPKASGSLHQMILTQVHNKEAYIQRDYNYFLSVMTKFLTDISTQKPTLFWKISEDGVNSITKIPRKREVLIEARDWNGKNYQRLSFFLQKQGAAGPSSEKNLLSLEFFVRTCGWGQE